MQLLTFLFLAGSILCATSQPVLFPMPKAYVSGDPYTLGYFIANQTVSAPTEQIENMAKKYLNNIAGFIFYANVGVYGQVASIETTIDSDILIPVDAPQGYSISISSSKITVHADSVFSAFYAYETIAQLIKYDEADSKYYIYAYNVTDSPRFPWRGVLIDTARHFLPLSAIKRQIIALAAAKMNVLHWHLVDAEAFPWKSNSHPEMVAGAYQDGTLYYTSDDIKSIYDFGLMWGVMVYVEIDSPGHAYSWKKAYPEVIAKCPDSYSANINNFPLDISQDLAYDLSSSLFNELHALTNGKYLHFGGDEVVTTCWKNDPDTVALMNELGTDAYGIWRYYSERLDGMINKDVVPVFWQEEFNYNAISGVRDTAIVQAWSDQETLGKIVKAGYRGLLSAGWYLDQQLPVEYESLDDVNYAFYMTWKDFFHNEPTKGLNLTPEQEALILGGEAAMFAEGVDAASIDTFIWPRALAVSQRLWISKGLDNEDDAKTRIQAQRCKLAQRGVGAGPIGPNEPCEGQFKHWNYEQYNK